MTAAKSHTFTSPVGRLVGGDPFTPNTKGFDNQPLVDRSGNPKKEYIVQVAFPKSDPATDVLRGMIYDAAIEGFPTLFNPDRSCIFPAFSFKWQDGDSAVPNLKGNKPCEKEGFPGNWVLTFKSSFAPGVYDVAHNELIDPRSVKRGDYVRVAGSCKGNDQQQKPGVYLNHSLVELFESGVAIASGPDAATAFAAPAQLPAGAHLAPAGGLPAPGPAVPAGAPALALVPPVAAVPVAAAPAGAIPVVPAPGGLPAPVPVPGFGAAVAPPPVAAPPVAAAPIAPAPPLAKQTLPGCPHTYEALKGNGWTDEMMRAQGFLA